MGDNEAPMRTSAHDCVFFVISQAQKFEDIASELYCQILSQLTANGSKDSTESGFQLLAMLIVSALPDEELMDYVIAFVKRLEESAEYKIVGHECMNRLRWAAGSRFSLRKMPPTLAELKLIQVCYPF